MAPPATSEARLHASAGTGSRCVSLSDPSRRAPTRTEIPAAKIKNAARAATGLSIWSNRSFNSSWTSSSFSVFEAA